MSEIQEHPPPPGPTERPEAGALFQLLTSGNRDSGQVYTAIREVESMAGQSVVAQLTALIRSTAAEQTSQFQVAIGELTVRIGDVDSRLTTQTETTNARLDSVEKQLGRIWTFLFLILGTLTTLLTTLLLSG